MKKSSIVPFLVCFLLRHSVRLANIGREQDLTALQEKGHMECKTSLWLLIFLLSFLHTESAALY